MMRLEPRNAALALGGDVVAGGVVCPGPGHSARDRSLSVRLDAAAPDGFIVYSHAGDDPMVCRDHVRDRLGLPSWHAGTTTPRPAVISRSPTQGQADEARRISLALGIWRECVGPAGTLAETYVRSRGLWLPEEVANGGALRFHPACPFRMVPIGEERATTIRLPAMVCIMVDPATNSPRAIHRTALRPDGAGKAEMIDGGPAKRWLGAGRGAVIKLSPDDAVTNGLGLSEGIENGLTVLCAAWGPVWACGSAGNLAAFPVLSGVECLTVFADRGEAGERAADDVARRWIEHDREAEIRLPLGDDDFCDVWEESAA